MIPYAAARMEETICASSLKERLFKSLNIPDNMAGPITLICLSSAEIKIQRA